MSTACSGGKFYVVKVGRNPGIYRSWEECSSQVNGYSGAVYKSFKSKSEAYSWYSEKDSLSNRYTRSVFRPTDSSNCLVAYTDGACTMNGRRGSRAGIGVYFPNGYKTISEGLPASFKQTNQQAELYAAIRAVEEAPSDQPLDIRTDSMYVVNGMNSWIKNWKRKNWNVPVDNIELFKRLDRGVSNRKNMTTFTYVKGHTGIQGNEIADRLAVNGINLKSE
ncbi:ribonuclease H-like isoform X2 [Schistocerca gregaria]|nr:ribonuclease H-like isoform X2 [Schistocerca gregaria]